MTGPVSGAQDLPVGCKEQAFSEGGTVGGREPVALAPGPAFNSHHHTHLDKMGKKTCFHFFLPWIYNASLSNSSCPGLVTNLIT